MQREKVAPLRASAAAEPQHYTLEELRRAVREEIAPRASPILADLAGEWLPLKLKRIPGSADTFAARVRDHLLPKLGRHTSASLLPSGVERWMNQLAERYSPQTVNHCRDAGRQLVDWAIRDRRWPGANPFAQTSPLELPHREQEVITAREALAFLEAVPARWRNLFAIAVYLGPRKGELLALRRAWVDLELKLISFNGSHASEVTKTGDQRRNIPVPEELLPYLVDALRRSSASEYLFPAENGERLTRDTKLVDVTAAALAGAGVVGEAGRPRAITFHGLRRVSSSLHQEAGCHPWVVSKVLGHSQASLVAAGNAAENTTAKHYTTFSREFVRAELNKLSLKRAAAGELALALVAKFPASVLTVDQVARRLKLSARSARRLIARGPLPGSYRDGELVVRRTDLRRYVWSAA